VAVIAGRYAVAVGVSEHVLYAEYNAYDYRGSQRLVSRVG
jgi:hypothetical protein